MVGYDAVRIALGIILLTAAALKGHQLATEPVAEAGLFTSRWFLIGVVEFELFFGLWLVAGLHAKGTWCAALLCFGGFACLSLYKALSGEASCGCFGKVPVSPWYTLLLDVAAVAALVCWRPAPRDPPVRVSVGVSRRGVAAIAGVYLLAGIPAAVAMGTYRAATLSGAGIILGHGDVVVLEPRAWVGRRFPLLDYIDIGDQLAAGQWIVVLYHHDCPTCQEVIPDYARLARVSAASSGAPQVALIELPPYGSRTFSFGASCRQGRLSAVKDWFVASPVECTLDGGLVAKVSVEPDELKAGEVTLVRTHRGEKQ
ncbi:MAG: MauE/DoxX family redox-associated membrane protein [Planctomycetota bacterium]|jgi:hypothetical protein